MTKLFFVIALTILLSLTLSRADGQSWMAVGLGRDVQAVPMDDRRLGQVVDEVNPDSLAGLEAEQRSQVAVGQGLHDGLGAAEHAGLVAPDPRGRPWQDADRGWRRTQFDLDCRRRRRARLGRR